MTLPYNKKAEESLLGCLIGEPETMIDVVEMIKPENFYVEKNQKIYRALYSMYANGTAIDMVSLAHELNNELDKVGGNQYIGELVMVPTTYANAVGYAKIVLDDYKSRELIKACTSISNELKKENPDSAIAGLQDRLFKIAGTTDEWNKSADQLIIEASNEVYRIQRLKGELPGIQSGFYKLDRVLLGLNKSDLIILAARPAVGKSAFATTMMYNMANEGKKVLMFSLEMSGKQVADRVVSIASGIELMKIKLGTMNPREETIYNLTNSKLANLMWFVNDRADINMAQIRSAIQKQIVRTGVDVAIIDYLQLINGSDMGENRQNQVSAISRGLKIIAKDLHLPIVALSQLNREGANTRPQLSQLRDSGAIEQDADIVVFLHKTDTKKGDKEVMEVIIAKNRNGQTTMIPFAWIPNQTKFVEA